MRSRDLTTAVVVALLVAAPDLTAQRVSPTLGQAVAWQVFQADGPPTITGTVVNAMGEPQAGVRISVLATERTTTTDSSGRFTLVLSAAGEWMIRIGASSGVLTVDLTVPSASRVVLVAVLPDGRRLCHEMCIGTRCEDLQLRVVDSLTNRSPGGVLTLRLMHPTDTLVRRVDLGAGGTEAGIYTGIGRRVETTGFHTIEVSVPGYELWRKERVWLEQVRACEGMLLGREQVARLVRRQP